MLKTPKPSFMDAKSQEGNDLELELEIELIAAAVRGVRQPATRANEIWSVEIVRGANRPVILVIDNFSGLPMEAHPTYGTDAHIVSILDVAGQLRGYPAKLWVSSDHLFESRELESWAAQHRIRVIFHSQSRITRPLVEELHRDCLNNLDSTTPAEMAWALRCWRQEVITRLTGAE
jgi:hypothetical protein